MKDGGSGFAAIQEAIAGYLDAERDLGRLPDSVDPHTVALAVVGTAHHLREPAGRAPPTRGRP